MSTASAQIAGADSGASGTGGPPIIRSGDRQSFPWVEVKGTGLEVTTDHEANRVYVRGAEPEPFRVTEFDADELLRTAQFATARIQRKRWRTTSSGGKP
jgi:hypothetical protein